jgi:opacity protein-like surface antigen
MKVMRYIFLLGFILLINPNCVGQNQDLGLWTGIKVSKKINKKFAFFTECQVRFMQNGTNFESLFIQGGIDFELTKWYQLGGAYRYSNYGDLDANRFDIDNTFSHKIKDNSFAIRLKYQKSFVTHKLKGDRFRIRFKYSYKINKKVKPYFKAQYFFTKAYDYANWSQQRYSLGAVIRIAKKKFIDVFYNYEFEYNLAKPEKQYVLGVKYKLNYK